MTNFYLWFTAGGNSPFSSSSSHFEEVTSQTWHHTIPSNPLISCSAHNRSSRRGMPWSLKKLWFPNIRPKASNWLSRAFPQWLKCLDLLHRRSSNLINVLHVYIYYSLSLRTILFLLQTCLHSQNVCSLDISGGVDLSIFFLCCSQETHISVTWFLYILCAYLSQSFAFLSKLSKQISDPSISFIAWWFISWFSG